MDSMKNLLQSQHDILAKLKTQIEVYESSDLFTQNQQLKNQLAKLMADHEALNHHTKELKEHNARLKQALFTQADLEREFLVNQSKERLEIYFSKALAYEADKLTELERSIKERTNQIVQQLEKNRVDMSHPLYAKIWSIKEESWKVIQEAQAQQLVAERMLTDADHKAYDKLKKEPITADQVILLAKKFSMERFVGLNLISTIGIILIIVATIFAAQFTYVRLTDAQRAIGIFIFGGALLMAGEYFNRKKPNVLSLVITAGGVVILYVALAFSYFVLYVFGVIWAIIICVAITGVAFVLSTRYRSQTLLVFAFVGGHMPYFAISVDSGMIYGLMTYVFILNLLILLVSFKMKWVVPTCIGLTFNIIAVGDILRMTYTTDANVSAIMLAGFVFLSFFNYMAIPLVGTYVTKGRFTAIDAVVMAINTFASCLAMYVVFYIYGWGNFNGLLALIYAIVYFTLAFLLWRKYEDAKVMGDLCALTGLVFIVLIIPFQFDIVWLSLGWLMQGVAMSIYGILKNRRRVMYAGMIIFGLCIFTFIFVDIEMYVREAINLHFGLRYLSITVGSLLILSTFIYRLRVLPPAHKVFKYAVFINLWVYSFYLVFQLPGRIDGRGLFDTFYLAMALQVMVTLVLAYGFTRIKVLFDSGTRRLAILFYIVGIVGLFLLNLGISPNLISIGIGSGNPMMTVVSTVILMFVGGFAVFCLYDLLRHFVARSNLPSIYLQVIISIYTLVVVTQNLIIHYDVAFTSVWISVFYMFVALSWVVFGFLKQFVLMRRYGLGLALLTVCKLIFIDLAGLTTAQRIVSLFVIGMVMVGIAFVYQMFIKKLEERLKLDDNGLKLSDEALKSHATNNDKGDHP